VDDPAGACLMLAGGYWFLAHRGVLRWVAFAVVVLAPVTVLVIFALHGSAWRAGTGRRHWWPGSPPSMLFRSW
jgi:hypothetical protein